MIQCAPKEKWCQVETQKVVTNNKLTIKEKIIIFCYFFYKFKIVKIWKKKHKIQD